MKAIIIRANRNGNISSNPPDRDIIYKQGSQNHIRAVARTFAKSRSSVSIYYFYESDIDYKKVIDTEHIIFNSKQKSLSGESLCQEGANDVRRQHLPSLDP